ncbi:MAG: tetraacyldisaccharide 4'-kinase [Halothiobacillus sp.]
MRYPAFWQRRGLRSLLLWPISLLTCRLAARRRKKARKGIGVVAINCPVIIIGNITVGGTGKTPVLIALAEALTQRGKKVGIISRGYGAKIGVEPRDVAESESPKTVGDEPWLIHQRLGLPVVVHPDRVSAAEQLRARYPEVDVILSDDGLQHHRLARTIEMVVIDGTRRLGNQFCLPAGPLREPAKALASMDFVLVSGEPFEHHTVSKQWPVQFELLEVRDLHDQQSYSFAAFQAKFQQAQGQGAEVSALAGIGNPERFFDALRTHGLKLRTYALADHQPVPPALLNLLGRLTQPLLMTEKDAVKWLNHKPVWHQHPGQVFAVIGRMQLTDELIASVLALLAQRSQPP